MRLFSIKSTSTLMLALAFAGLGCSSSSDSGSSAIVQGRVDGNESRQKTTSVENASVTAATVTSSGSISKIDGTSVQSQNNGNFSLDVDATAAQNFVIVAEDGTNTWNGFLETGFDNSSRVTIKPIDIESTAETSVFAQLVASSQYNNVTKADIEAMITNEVSSEISGSASLVSQYSAAVSNSATARARFFANEVEGDASAKLNATLDNMREAQVNLESQLNSSSSAAAYNSALETFLNAKVDAYTSAGVNESNTAKSIELESRLFLNNVSSASANVQNSARAQASILLATAMDNAIRVQASAAELSTSSQARIQQAGNTLKSEIRAAAGVEASVNEAFETYKNEVQATLEDDSSIEASVIVQIDNDINAFSGPKSTFETAISTVANADVAINIYDTFFADIESTVESNVDSSTSASKIEAIVETMLLINLAS